MTNTVPAAPDGSVELYWIPVGAGTRFQEFSLAVYERVASFLARREPATLLHAGLKLRAHGRTCTLETMPSPPGPNTNHEVTGPVGVRGADRLRLFRYQVCVRETSALPDEEWAVAPPVRVGDGGTAVKILALAKEVPAYTWGRRRKGHPEMWTSDSCVSWLLLQAGIDAGEIAVPAGCRAPGWFAGIAEARAPSNRRGN